MGQQLRVLVLLSLLFWAGCFYSSGQIEESAEISLEAYSDEFQEKFFEALKEKAIGNYDRAIALFRECQELERDLPVVAYQLAKLYLLEHEYEAAYYAARKAYEGDTEQFWYLQTLVDASRKRGMTPEQLLQELGSPVQQSGTKIALAYFRVGAFQEVLQVLDELPSNPINENLRVRVTDSIQENKTSSAAAAVESGEGDIENRIRTLVLDENYSALGPASSEALEEYPAEPYFYFARGLFLTESGRLKEAAEVLEEGLLYLLEDPELERAFYKQLAAVYTALEDPERATMYLNKIE